MRSIIYDPFKLWWFHCVYKIYKKLMLTKHVLYRIQDIIYLDFEWNRVESCTSYLYRIFRGFFSWWSNFYFFCDHFYIAKKYDIQKLADIIGIVHITTFILHKMTDTIKKKAVTYFSHFCKFCDMQIKPDVRYTIVLVLWFLFDRILPSFSDHIQFSRRATELSQRKYDLAILSEVLHFWE